jgi:hypothetical protein
MLSQHTHSYDFLTLLQELITKCTVVTEKALKAAISKTTARKRAFKRLSAAEQEAAAAEVVGERGDSAAAFFDLLALRKTGRNRVTQVRLTRGARQVR